MSKLSTQQIIQYGEYLNPDFDPTTLTMAHLLGIFQYHNITYPSQHNKAKLVEVFNESIKVNAKRLRKQRLVREETPASIDGIIDGVTGKPIAPDAPSEPNAPAPVRRSSRRPSRGPSIVEVPKRPEHPKRRRSSAQPQLGRATSKKHIISPPTLSEASEEEESEPEPMRKVGRSNKDSDAAGPSARRVSQKFGPGTVESGWEDNNVFQSGNESSSPVRAPKVKRESSGRKSSAKKSRMSMSAPPEMSSPTRPSFAASAVSPPQSRFEPELPESVMKPRSRLVPVKSEDVEGFAEDISGFADVSAEQGIEEEEEFEREVLQGEQDVQLLPPDVLDLQKEVSEVSQRLAGTTEITRPTPRSRSITSTLLGLMLRLFVVLSLGSMSTTLYLYKSESAPLGFCDTGKDTNSALTSLRKERQTLQQCELRNIGKTDLNTCPLLVFTAVPLPDTCTTCPAHASCTRTKVQCDEGYIPKPHLLSLVPFASQLVDGIPGFGPVAFPPKCVIDFTRKQNIGRLGKRIDNVLAVERGRRLCAGVGTDKEIDGGDARKWGFEINQLKEVMHTGKDAKTPIREGETYTSAEDFDGYFGEAVDQLKKYGRIISGFDSEGQMYLGSDHEEMSWNCRSTVAIRQGWAEWRKTVIASAGFALSLLYMKGQIAARKSEDRRVAELVQIVLDYLRNQELAHHTDPVSNPHPFLSSTQLRDAILMDEHSVAKRRRLWGRVERVVEGNANVRTNMEEIHGDEVRVWHWVGSSGLMSPAAKRVQAQSPDTSYDTSSQLEMTEGTHRRFIA